MDADPVFAAARAEAEAAVMSGVSTPAVAVDRLLESRDFGFISGLADQGEASDPN
jgi:hypothetical protein